MFCFYCSKLIFFCPPCSPTGSSHLSLLCVRQAYGSCSNHGQLASTSGPLHSCYLCLPVGCLGHFTIGTILFFRSQPEACLLSKEEARLKYLITLSHHPILIPCVTVNHTLEYFLFIYSLFSFE